VSDPSIGCAGSRVDVFVFPADEESAVAKASLTALAAAPATAKDPAEG